MVIGNVTYTEGQLLALLPSGTLHTGGYVNALSQFIAAVLNLTAGAQNGSIDSTVSTINTDLNGSYFCQRGRVGYRTPTCLIRSAPASKILWQASRKPSTITIAR